MSVVGILPASGKGVGRGFALTSSKEATGQAKLAVPRVVEHFGKQVCRVFLAVNFDAVTEFLIVAEVVAEESVRDALGLGYIDHRPKIIFQSANSSSG